MDPKQLVILNSLVTFAAENVPGGLNEDEQEVARLVGQMLLAEKTHNYKVVNASHHKSVESAATDWSEMGWRVVAALASRGPGYADQLILERPVGITHPND
jgi:hypothetical protein